MAELLWKLGRENWALAMDVGCMKDCCRESLATWGYLCLREFDLLALGVLALRVRGDRGKVQAALKETRDKLASECEALKTAHAEEVSTMREDNHVLQERVENLQEEVKQLREEMVLLRRLVTRENGTSPHSTLSVPMARVVKPKPGASREKEARGRKIHSRGEDRRGSRAVLKCFRCKGPHKKKDCPKKAVFVAKVGQSGAPSSDGERDSGMVDAKIVSTLPRKLPPEEEVGCVRNSVARSPREVVLPKQGKPRQRRSRRSRNGCKAERKAESPSHKDREGTETQKKAEGNRSHGQERSPGRRQRFRGKFDREVIHGS
ncbi:hypothetical protein GH714_034871 [Hevea brasiliensis]|uniref:Uncharacterized protein n=1 Tax=Hevea brasiliensis TaxID=3981 RepID=A0A6A6N748_HEVBR|nr:hypothetical protein GH714_034871 [Hevea brasiliensis]